MSFTLALPKGRIAKELVPLLARSGITPEPAFFDDAERQLAFATNQPDIRLIRVRSFDVATYVAFGAAQVGVCGSDVLAEFDYATLYAPVDLNIGHCRMSVAALNDADIESLLATSSHVRVATKYPRLTERFFASKGLQAECIKLSGALELAPKMGLAPLIVDLVSTGSTLKANGLREVETIMHASSKLIVSRSAYKAGGSRIHTLIRDLRETLHE